MKMKKIAILGCENAHARVFLDFIKQYEKYADVEVVGVYSYDKEAMQRLSDNYGVKMMESFDEAIDDSDGVIITARHGDNHYKYASPYIKKGIPMFIDKPITVSEDEAVKFMRECRESGVRVTGGSCCIYDEDVLALKDYRLNEQSGKTPGGYVCAPISLENEYGGFFFYAQHLVAALCEIFGLYPNSVSALKKGATVNVTFRYDDYDVVGLFMDNCYNYHAVVATEKGIEQRKLDIVFDNPCFLREFDEFYKLLCGGEQKISCEDFIAPVHIMNAIARAMESGKEEKINYAKI
jgi:predicted dehydrogenase